MTKFQQWAVQQHRDTNHYYDHNLPYEFHLAMVAREVRAFKDDIVPLIQDIASHTSLAFAKVEVLENAAWGHDLIEDCRVSFNDIRSAGVSYEVAEIIYAVTNEKGRDREERANDKYYEGIRNTPGASFIKLCDRIANVKYGLMTGNTEKVKCYSKENPDFIKKVVLPELRPMADYLEKLFTIELSYR